MSNRNTRAAARAARDKNTLPRPRQLQFTPPQSNSKQKPTPQSKKNKRKNKNPTPKGSSSNTTATTPTAARNSTTSVSVTAPEIPASNSSISDTEETMAARVPFPPFKTDDIESWFRRVEHWFTFGKITTEADKFALIASQIENTTVTNLAEMLTPDADTPYTHLKKKIISIFEATTSAKINNLLSGCKLGDLKPSQLLAEMKRLGGTVGDDILRSLWAKRLPLHVQAVVAAATKSNLDEVALIADAVIDVVGTPIATTVNQVSSNNNQQSSREESPSTKSNEIESLCAAVNQLTKSFRDMQSDRSRSKSRDNQRSRDRSSSSSFKPAENRICRYHRKFGANAYLCTKPCNFVADSEQKN